MADSLTTKIAALKACAVQSLQTCTSCDEYDTADCSACITARGCLLLLDVAELTADYCCCEGEDLNRTTACQTALDALERGLPGGERR